MRIGMMILSVGVLALLSGLGCEKSMNTPQPVVQPSAKVELEETAMPFFRRELNKQIDLYMFAGSGDHQRCAGIWEDWNRYELEDYWRQTWATGLVAAARIERLGEAAVPAMVERVKQSPRYNGCDQRSVAVDLLSYLGPAGLKAQVRCTGWEGPLTDEDSDWIQYLDQLLAETTDSDVAQLFWLLTGDEEAIGIVEQAIDETINELTDLYENSSANGDWDARFMQWVLAISPVDGGVSDAKLKDWAQDSGSEGIRYAATLALASRGDSAAQDCVRDIIRSRFPLTAQEQDKWRALPVFPEKRLLPSSDTMFRFVRQLAKSSLEDRWKLLLDLLADTDPKLLAPRAAVLVALEEHWAELPVATQFQAAKRVAQMHWRENNKWLQAMMMSFLAQHPVEDLELAVERIAVE